MNTDERPPINATLFGTKPVGDVEGARLRENEAGTLGEHFSMGREHSRSIEIPDVLSVI